MKRALWCGIVCWWTGWAAEAALPDTILDRVIESQSKARVVIALRLDPVMPSRSEAIEKAVSFALRNVDAGQLRVHARYRRVPALIATVGAHGLSALRANPHVIGVEWDGGGYGIEIEPQPVNKLDRVAVLDTGIPLQAEIGAPDKLRSEVCFCTFRHGVGCCPDGSVRQEGPGSTREDLPFETSSLAWLRSTLPPNANVVSWAPAIAVVKVLSRQDRFDSWEPVFAALEELLDGTGNLNRVLFSFASSRLYRAPDCGGSAAAAVLRDVIAQFNRQGIESLVARASGGPGPGWAIPGCLESAAQARGRVTERLAKPEISGGGMDGNPGSPGGPPPSPVDANGSALYGIIEALAALPDAEIPPIDTAANVKWWRITVRVAESASLQPGLTNLVAAGQVLDFTTYDPVVGLAVGQGIKFSAAQAGSNVRRIWYATGFRLVDSTPAGAFKPKRQ